eukprot:GHVL01026504.1.p1 GENE.GHVL01026504.1~~GHVL01026504.1.p1  ORF type:complete len:470 (-),score=108.88 GHVL01026504.1:166-1575(-)
MTFQSSDDTIHLTPIKYEDTVDEEFSPPWLNKDVVSDNFLLRLHEEIMDFCFWISPTPEERSGRTQALSRVIREAEALWPDCKPLVFGSCSTDLCLPGGDIDLCLLDVGEDEGAPLRKFARRLQLSGVAGPEIELVTGAKVPIIKFTDSITGLPVDISFNMYNARETSLFVEESVKKFPAARYLIVFLKYFLAQRGLGETYTGGIGSYLLCTMIVSMLQMHERSTANEYRNNNLGCYLVDFLEFYAIKFNFQICGLRVSNNGSYFRKGDKIKWNDRKSNGVSCISVESPLDDEIDLGKNAYNIKAARQAFLWAYQELCVKAADYAKNPKKKSILCPGMICSHDPVIRKRFHVKLPTKFINRVSDFEIGEKVLKKVINEYPYKRKYIDICSNANDTYTKNDNTYTKDDNTYINTYTKNDNTYICSNAAVCELDEKIHKKKDTYINAYTKKYKDNVIEDLTIEDNSVRIII